MQPFEKDKFISKYNDFPPKSVKAVAEINHTIPCIPNILYAISAYWDMAKKFISGL